MPKAIIFATMRRSGSHFCMHRALSSIKLESNSHFGIHINSIGPAKLSSKKANEDLAKVLCYRKQNYFYTREHRAKPRDGGDSPFLVEAAYANMTGMAKCTNSNPSGLLLSFIAINIEDETVDATARMAENALSAFCEDVRSLPVFIPLRALRSIALSRKKWIETKGARNIMAGGFKSTSIPVWRDHYKSATNGFTSGGRATKVIHYGEAVKTSGQSAVDDFREGCSGKVDVLEKQLRCVKDTVLRDGSGSSFVGAGVKKASEVAASISDRAARLEEFAWMLESCEEAKEHAKTHGEL